MSLCECKKKGVPITEGVAFDTSASGKGECNAVALTVALDDWARHHGTTWQGDRSSDGAQRRMVVSASPQTSLDLSAQAHFLYHQRTGEFEIELALYVDPAIDKDIALNEFEIDDFWRRIQGACHPTS